MKWTSPNKPINLPMLLKQAGFHIISDYKAGGKQSWVRLLGRGHYPRFHLYPSQSASGAITFDLHLDQKQSTINLPGLKRHGGEYEGAAVEAELERIKRWYAYISSTSR